MRNQKWRSVIHESDFAEQLQRLIREDEDADEYIAAVVDVLSRDPEAGVKITPLVWEIITAPVNDMTIRVFYTFDDETVNLLWIIGE